MQSGAFWRQAYRGEAERRLLSLRPAEACRARPHLDFPQEVQEAFKRYGDAFWLARLVCHCPRIATVSNRCERRSEVAQGPPLRAKIRLLAEACGEALLNARNLVMNGATLRDPTQRSHSHVIIHRGRNPRRGRRSDTGRPIARAGRIIDERPGHAGLADVVGRAETALHTASDKVREQAETVSGKVRAQPLLAVLIAAAIGFVLGRVTR